MTIRVAMFHLLQVIQESFLAIKNEDDVKKLQNDLKTIYKWQQINNIQLNENKFELKLRT